MNELSDLENNIRTSEKLLNIIFALLIGFIFDKIVRGQPFGLSYFIFIFLSISFFLWSQRKVIKLQVTVGWLLLIPINLLAFNFVFYTNAILQLLNILVISILMVVSSILISDKSVEWDKLVFLKKILKKIYVEPFKNISTPFKILMEVSNVKNKKELSPIQKQILIGLLISLPLLFVITLLLISADMVFSYYISNITSIFYKLNPYQIIFETLVILVIAVYLFGYVWAFKKNDKEILSNKVEPAKFEAVIIITILSTLNVLYTIFTSVQFSYLYKWVDGGLPTGFTFAEYARRGFFELSAVTLVNFIILLFSFTFMKKENKKLSIIANIMMTLLIVFTLNMLWSAHSRLHLYELTYGFTYLRVFVHMFMVLLFFLCLIALVTIWYRKIPLIKTVIMASILFYTGINYINVDGFIIKENIVNKKIDIEYFIGLSDEVVPYLVELKSHKELNQNEINLINDNLQEREARLNNKDKWYEFNFSENKTRKILNKKP